MKNGEFRDDILASAEFKLVGRWEIDSSGQAPRWLLTVHKQDTFGDR